MHTLRTRFKKDIVAEFLAPKRFSQKAIIFCGGMPGYPSKEEVMEFFMKKGYWVFSPRYRGSWESGGKFLRVSPEQDILDIISELPKGFKDFYNNKKYKPCFKKIYLFASSFGGPAAILASRDSRVNKAVAISPVIDWLAQGKSEPLDWLEKFTKDAFGKAYRFTSKDWAKLKSGNFYNPVNHIKEIDGNKIFIIHAKDDDVVLFRPVKRFARNINCRFKTLKKGGHLSTILLTKPTFYRQVRKFLVSK